MTAARPTPRKFWLLGCTALTLLPVGVLAQDAAPDLSYRLSPIIVNVDVALDDDGNSVVAQELWTGGKVATSILDTPASVSVITAEEIEQRNADTLETVLNYTPGVHTDFYGSDDRNDYVQMRGFPATSYRDGLTLGSMRDVREDPFAYSRVEAIRGANSTLFGVSDPGGSINFVSKQPQFERFGEVYSTVGSNNHGEVGVDFGDTLNDSGTLAYRLTGRVQRADREYATGRDDGSLLMGGLTWAPSDATAVTVVVDQLKRDTTPNSGGYPIGIEYDRAAFFGDPDQNDQDTDRSSISILARHDVSDALQLRANLRYSDLTDTFGYVYLAQGANQAGSVYQRDFFEQDRAVQELIGNVVLQYDAQFATFDTSTLAGFEFRDRDDNAAGAFGDASDVNIATSGAGTPSTIRNVVFASDQTRDTLTQSVFLQQNVAYDDRIIGTVGVRRDWLDLSAADNLAGTSASNEITEDSWRAALTYKVSDAISVYGSYVESVSPPSLSVTALETNLLPNRGSQYELGVKYQPAGVNGILSAAVYELSQDNQSTNVLQSDGSIVQELVGETRARGFEIEGKAELTDRLGIVAGYAYTDTEIVKTTAASAGLLGNAVETTPKHTASVWVNYTQPAGAVLQEQTFGVGARYVGEYFYSSLNDRQAEAAIIVDASYGYALDENAEVVMNVSNLFDEQHVVGSFTTDYYNPGRSIAVTLRQSW